jgi:mRNA (guanine-N7-)-methyltransferase
MFSLHYAFESEAKARTMLRNVAGALKKGGRFLGAIPNSDILTAKVNEYNKSRGIKSALDSDSDDDWDPEKTLDSKPKAAEEGANGASSDPKPKEAEAPSEETETLDWGNSIYRIRFPHPHRLPADGVFRPPFGWKYFYFLEEAVEEIPEYVVPWEAFRAMAVDYDLELQYKKPFTEVWEAEKDDQVLGPLSERMGVRERGGGELLASDDERDAAGFYIAFCFYKV